MVELIVRINELVKSNKQQDYSEMVNIGKYQFHFVKQILKIAEEETYLTHREAQLLKQLYLHKNDLTDRSVILKELWGNDDFFNARSMDVFITKLRKKLKDDPSIQILNIRGYGYKLIF